MAIVDKKWSPSIDQNLSQIRLQIDDKWPGRAAWIKNYKTPFFLNPYYDLIDGFSESAQPSYATISVIGRQEGYKFFQGVSNRAIRLRIPIRAQELAGKPLTTVLQEQVHEKVMWLEATKYPIKSNQIKYAPPTLFLLMTGIGSFRVITTQANITWEEPLHPETLQPYGATVDCEFTCVSEIVGDFTNIPNIQNRMRQ